MKNIRENSEVVSIAFEKYLNECSNKVYNPSIFVVIPGFTWNHLPNNERVILKAYNILIESYDTSFPVFKSDFLPDTVKYDDRVWSCACINPFVLIIDKALEICTERTNKLLREDPTGDFHITYEKVCKQFTSKDLEGLPPLIGFEISDNFRYAPNGIQFALYNEDTTCTERTEFSMASLCPKCVDPIAKMMESLQAPYLGGVTEDHWRFLTGSC